MNRNEHLLTCLAEECAEVAQRVSKALRFGINEVQQGQPLNNAERIMCEINDLIAVVEMLQTENVLVTGPDRAAINAKKSKLGDWLKYSAECGTVKTVATPNVVRISDGGRET